MSALPEGIGTLLPSRAQCDRGSTVVHAAPLLTVEGETAEEGPFRFLYPSLTALCGVAGWGEAGRGAEVTCKRCLRSLAAREEEGEAGNG